MRINAARSDGEVETIKKNGREYLKFPIVPMREMVMNYPEWDRREYLPAKEIEESADRWNGVSLTLSHPDSAGTSDSYTSDEVGRFFDPESIDGGEKLRGNGLIDVQKAESMGGLAEEVVDDLRANKEIEVSAGYSLSDPDTRPGRYNGKQYGLTQQGLEPDHIAVFPKGEFKARCDSDDGCAAPRANFMEQNPDDSGIDPDDLGEEVSRSVGRTVLNAIGFGGSDECHCDDDEGEGEDDRNNAEEEEEGDESGGNPDEEDTEPDMADDERVNQIASELSFSEEDLTGMDDEQIDDLHGLVDRENAEESESSDDSDSTDESGGSEPDYVTKDDIAEMQSEFLSEAADHLKEQQEKERNARVLADNSPGMEKEDFMSMSADKLSDRAEGVRANTEGQTSERANYGGIPGEFERENTEEEDEYPAGSRAAYQARQEGDD